ncbi:hypothetical protein ALC56_07074 [Trachymyrmex septentrionalis]|uniref:Uncharacterized protein n=1 Tax=Trachymyrmex septentrionalis TaxID=34720 RepID=A0A195FDY0_9HYME|nr:hypothetical protein ALC56_07074 [Trachymyrmex septentrionalis]
MCRNYISSLDILVFALDSLARRDYQLPTSTGQTLFPNDRAIMRNVRNQLAMVCTVVSIGPALAMKCCTRLRRRKLGAFPNFRLDMT